MRKPVDYVPESSKLTFEKDLGMRPVGRGLKRYVLYLCECGNKKEILVNHVKSGKIVSCGCYQRQVALSKLIEINKDRKGISKHPLYGTWKSMIQRCYHKNHKSYPIYGGINVKVCAEWRNDPQTFFDWAMGKGWKTGLEIHRVFDSLIYSPEYCLLIPRNEHRSEHMRERNVMDSLNRRAEKLPVIDDRQLELYDIWLEASNMHNE